MDLFSLVAKLTLDAKEYEKAIKDAERTGKGAKIDASGTISVTDNYSAAVASVNQAADQFDGDREGTLTGHDDYSDDEQAAQQSADNFNGDKNGTLTGLDDYSDEETSAQDSADAFSGDVSGTIEGADNYSTEESTAQASANAFNGDVSGTIDGTDNYSGLAENAKSAATDFNGTTAEGTIDVTDNVGDTIDNAANDIEAFDGSSGTSTIDVTDNVGSTVSDIKEDLQEIDGNTYTGTLEVTATTSGGSGGSDGSGGSSGGFNLGGVLKLGAIVGGVSTVANWVGGALDDTAKYADEVDKSSRRFSISMEAYQEWAHALSQSGASTQDLQRGLLNISKAAQGEGTQEVVDAFGKLGLTDLLDGTHKNEDILSEVITKLAGWEDRSERDYLVQTIFGRNGLNLNALLDSGVDGIKGLIQEAHDLGLIMSDEDVQKGVEYGDALANMKDAMEMVKMNFIESFMPQMIDLVGIATDILVGVGKLQKNPEEFMRDYVQKWFKVEVAETEEEAMANAGLGGEAGGTWQDYVWKLMGAMGISRQWKEFALLDPMNLVQAFGGSSTAMFGPHKGNLQSLYNEIGTAKEAQDETGILKALEKFREYVELMEYGYDPEQAMGKALEHMNALDISVNYDETIKKINEVGEAAKAVGGTYGIAFVVNSGVRGPSIPVKEATEGQDTRPHGGQRPGHNAKGLWEVPYDDYLTRLHRDEMVLTASQARDYKERDHGDSDVVEAIRGLRQDMTNLQIVVGQKTFGRTVVSYSGKRLGGYLGGAEDRLAAGYGWG